MKSKNYALIDVVRNFCKIPYEKGDTVKANTNFIHFTKWISAILIFTLIFGMPDAWGFICADADEQIEYPIHISNVNASNFQQSKYSYAHDMKKADYDLGENSPVSADDVHGIIGVKDVNLIEGGMRGTVDGVFEISEAGSVVAVEYYVMARGVDSPEVYPFLQSTKKDKNATGNTTYSQYGISDSEKTVVLENGVWEYRTEFYLITKPTTGDAQTDSQNNPVSEGNNYLRFVLGAGTTDQQTYIGGIKLYNFGADFEYEGKTGMDAVKLYYGIVDEEIPEYPQTGISVCVDDSSGIELLQSEEVLVPLSASYYDASKSGYADLDDDPLFDRVFRVSSKSSGGYVGDSLMSRFGIRTHPKNLLEIKEANSFIIADYWIKCELSDEATVENPQFLGRMQYCSPDGTSSGSTIGPVEGIIDTLTTENGKWYKCFQIYKITSPTTDDNRIRFYMQCGHLGQTTYVGGFKVYRAGADFEYGNLTGEKALVEYISDAGIRAISYDGCELENYSDNKLSYIIDTGCDDTTPAQTIIHTDALSQVVVSGEPEIGKTVTFDVSKYDISVATELGDCESMESYTLLYRKNYGIEISSANVAQIDNGDDNDILIEANINNSSLSRPVTVVAALYDDKNKPSVVAGSLSLKKGSNIFSEVIYTESAGNNYRVEIFVVDSLDGLVPLCDSYVVCGISEEDDYTRNQDVNSELLVETDFGNGVIEVKGQFELPLPLRYTVCATGENGEIVYIQSRKTLNDGSFSFEFEPADCSDTEYTLYICDEYSMTKISDTFTWYDDTSLEKVFDWFNKADEDDIKDMLASLENVFPDTAVEVGLVFESVIDDYMKLEEKDVIHSKIVAQKPYADISQILTLMESSVAEETICQEFRNAKDELSFEMVVSKYNEELGLYYKTEFGYDSLGEGKNLVVKAVSSGDFTDVSTLKELFNEEVILANFNTCTWGELEEIAVYYADEIGLNVSNTKYSNLSNTNKSKLYKTIADNDYTDISDIKEVFDETLSRLSKDSGSSGGGSGGGSKGASYQIIGDVDNLIHKTSEKPFKDVEDGFWADIYISDLYEKGIVSGDGSGNFYPSKPVTRAEFVKMLVLSLNIYDSASESQFADCRGKWYDSYVASAVNQGIVTGISDDIFNGDAIVTRQDMATMTYRAVMSRGIDLKQVNYNIDIVDEASIDGYAKTAVTSMWKAGILNGMGDGYFAPHSSCNRAMSAKVISHIMAIKAEGGTNE